ncbi:iron-containing alcohol dehydrogenase, partial [bacterium]|nr:iron-containing alcohol dehydrogenase [bacterium]
MREVKMRSFRFLMTTEVCFGEGVVSRVGQETSHLGKRALLVTGKQSSRRSGALGTVMDSLEQAGLTVEVFDQVEENPSAETVERGGEIARQ